MERVKRELYLFTNFAFCVSITTSLLNIEELHDTKYGLEILNKPVLLKETPEINTLLLASKHGQQYQCTLPEIESQQKQEDELQQVSTEEVAKLLQPMGKKCLYHNNGWWTYELCFGKAISQYHQEGNMVVGDKVLLGVYQSQTDWSKEDVMLKGKTSKTTTKRFHSHNYVNGTECDLTGNLRETLVKFMCEKGSPDALVRVDEPSTCSYILTVLTARLCDNPLFRPPADGKLHPITCSPALPQHHFDIYLETIESKRKASEAKNKAKAEARKRRHSHQKPDGPFEETGEPVEKKQKPKRSEVWPWQEPAVEAEDEMWLDGKIDKDTMGVHRMDITKTRRRDIPDDGWGRDVISIMSTKLQRKRQTGRPKMEGEETEAEKTIQAGQIRQTGVQVDESTGSDARGAGDETTSAGNSGPVGGGDSREAKSGASDVVSPGGETEEGGGDGAQETGKDDSAAAPTGGKSEHGTGEGDQKVEPGTPADTMSGPGGDEADHVTIESAVRERLRGIGVDPDLFDDAAKLIARQFQPRKDSQPTEPDAEEKPGDPDTSDRPSGGLAKPLDKTLNHLTSYVDGLERTGKLQKDSPEHKLLSGVRRLMEQMDQQDLDLMQKEEALLGLLQDQYAETRAHMQREVDRVKAMVAAMEASQDEATREALDSVRQAVRRYEDTSREIEEDMAAVTQLNKELLAKVAEVIKPDQEPEANGDLARLTSKARQLLSRLLSRSVELDGEMRALKRAGLDVMAEGAARGEDAGAGDTGAEVADDGEGLKMEKVFKRITGMIKDLGDKKKREVHKETSEKEDRETPEEEDDEDDDDDEESDEDEDDGGDSDQAPEPAKDAASGVRVRVTKIKKDGNPIWTEEDGEDLGHDPAATDMESKIRRATKHMENIMREHLKNSGVALAGKVRVKIVTSREALENFDEGSGTQLLSDEETAQFKRMLMGLLGGGQEAGKEKQRQMALEDNYNLVWDNGELGKAPGDDHEDDDDYDELEVFTL